MSKAIQWLTVGLLVVVAVLQVTVITQINKVKPQPAQSAREEPRIPSLNEIDNRIMHWTMHFGQHFSAKSQVSSLESKLEKTLLEIEKKIDVLSEEKKSASVNRETGDPSFLDNVALTNKQVDQVAVALSSISRGASVAVVFDKVPQLKGHAEEVFYPFAHGTQPGSGVIFLGQDEKSREAFERAQVENRLRKEWDATVKKYSFLSAVPFTVGLTVGKYTLNPAHALYLVTAYPAPGDERFVAAFVREEGTK